MTVVDEIRARAREAPDQPAVISASETPEARRVVSYAELVEGFDSRAQGLAAAGVGEGDRCGLVARQGADYVQAALGILAAGACFVPVSDDHQGASLDEFVRRARLHHLVSRIGDLGNPSDPGDPPGIETFNDVPAVDGAGDAEFRALSPAYLRFTSGTTSRRKGVIIGHAAVLERLAAANRALGIGPRDRILWLLPMAHHFVVSILLYLRNGATLVLPESSLARAVLSAATAESATVFYASPYHYRLLAKDTSGVRLDGVRLAVSTAEGLREDIAAAFRERFGFALVQALGIMEVGLPVINARSADTKPLALGTPLPDYDVWLRGDDGKPAVGPPGSETSGEICIRGPGLLDAYMDPWLPARELLGDTGFCTGDQGWYDADGDLHLLGRRATRISMAGMKFFGEEVEAVLDAHPAVRASRVFAREHAQLGEIPVAEVVPEAGCEPGRKELAAHCREHLPSYKIPRSFALVDALPVTETGKMSRRSNQPS